MAQRQHGSGKTRKRPSLVEPRWTAGVFVALNLVACSGDVTPETWSGQANDGATGENGVDDPLGATDEPAAPGTSSDRSSGGPDEGSAALPNPQASFDPKENDEQLSEQNPDVFARAQQFFPGSGGYSDKRLFRLTVDQLQATARVILPNVVLPELSNAMPPDPLETNYAYSDNLSVNGANFAPFAEWASLVGAAVSAAPQSVINCAESDEVCLSQESEVWVRRAFRNAAPDERVARLVEFFVQSVTEVGLVDAVRDLVDVTLTSPNFVFRDEASTDESGALLPAQRLQQLTYTLTDLPPEALGFELGSEHAVYASQASIEQATAAVLESDAARSKLLRFLMAWLEISAPEDFTLAPTVFPEFTPGFAAALVSDVQGWLEQGLASPSQSLKTITTGAVFGQSSALDGLYSEDEQGERFGVFTHPAFIAAHSGPETTRLVKRGVFFLRKVLCLEMQLPPAGVDTQIPNLPNVTERERVETATSVAACSGCHSLINPFGFMLERYDALGRYRLQDEAGLAIDSSVSIGSLSDVPIEANSAVDALPSLVSSDAFQQCFSRQIFRYYVGRSEIPEDDPTLRQMWFAFVNGDQNLVHILEQLGASEQLHYRQL